MPLDPENGHLNARRWVGGARRCAQQQTDYAASVEALGLSRGVEGSTAEHESVKRHYGQIAQPIAKLSIACPPRVLMDPEGWAAEQRQSLAKQAGPTFARARTAESDRTARKAAEAQAAKAQGRADRLQAAMDEQKALSARLRALPLPDVLDALGFAPDPAKRAAGRPRASTSPLVRGRRRRSGSTTPQAQAEAAALTLCSMSPDRTSKGRWRGWPTASGRVRLRRT